MCFVVCYWKLWYNVTVKRDTFEDNISLIVLFKRLRCFWLFWRRRVKNIKRSWSWKGFILFYIGVRFMSNLFQDFLNFLESHIFWLLRSLMTVPCSARNNRANLRFSVIKSRGDIFLWQSQETEKWPQKWWQAWMRLTQLYSITTLKSACISDHHGNHHG